MFKKGNLLIIVLFFALLTFAMWRFFTVREEVIETILVRNAQLVQARVEEFGSEAGGYPLSLDDPDGLDWTVAEKLEEDGLANPFGGIAAFSLSPGDTLPQKFQPGVVVYLPLDTSGGLAHDYRIATYDRRGLRLSLVLAPEEQ